MTHDEWTAYAEDLATLIYRSNGVVYELVDENGALQLLIQPRRRVDITRMKFPQKRRRRYDAPTLS